MKSGEVFMTALEAAVALGKARALADADKLEDARSAMKGYNQHLEKLSSMCYVGEDEMEREDVYGSYIRWLNAVEKDITTLKGDTETGAAIISFTLRACPCVCEPQVMK